MSTEREAGPVRVEPLVGRLRSASARTARLNADVALLCEAAIAGADRIERLHEALIVARNAVYNDAFQIGWNIDRLDEVLTPNAGAHRTAREAGGSECSALLGATHTGMRISAAGILGRIRDNRYYKGLNYGCGVMLGHLEEMAARFYAGDPTAVDEFLQLYCLDDARPMTPNAS